MKSNPGENTYISSDNTLMPDTLLYPAKDDTEGVVESANQENGFRAMFRARLKRNPLHPSLEKRLPLVFKKVYYDFSIVAYVIILVGTFATIIGVGVLASALFAKTI